MRRTIGIVLIAVLAIGIVFGATAIGTYNSLMAKEENVNNKLAAVDVNLQRRADLIPNLVETVKGYDLHEQSAIDSVTAARAKLGAADAAERVTAQNELSGALSALTIVVENYPDLKADANYRQLMDELAGTENRLGVARKDYNDAVSAYNAAIRRFPARMWAQALGFDPMPYLEAPDGSQEAPKVNFT